MMLLYLQFFYKSLEMMSLFFHPAGFYFCHCDVTCDLTMGNFSSFNHVGRNIYSPHMYM